MSVHPPSPVIAWICQARSETPTGPRKEVMTAMENHWNCLIWLIWMLIWLGLL
jgi:hypothetical protein